MVHPAPGAHISTAGCTILGDVHPVYAPFLSHLLLLYIERMQGAISRCTVLCELHPANVQNKSLISDTGISYIVLSLLLKIRDGVRTHIHIYLIMISTKLICLKRTLYSDVSNKLLYLNRLEFSLG